MTTPPAGALLFVPASNPSDAAHLGVPYLGLWDYANAYRRAAEVLFESAMAKEQLAGAPAYASTRTELILPYLYLVRHHFELALKACAQSSDEFDNVDPTHPEIHNLLALLKHLPGTTRPSVEEAAAAADCIQTIQQLHEADPGSFCFRYPTAKGGAHSLGGLPAEFDLRAFHGRATRASDHIAGWFFQMDHTLERVRMERHYSPRTANELRKALMKPSDPHSRRQFLEDACFRAAYWTPLTGPSDEVVVFCEGELALDPPGPERTLLLKLRELARGDGP